MKNISRIQPLCCPFRDRARGTCEVSFSQKAIDTRRSLLYCLSDDHDNCPFYLAEALRRSRPKSLPADGLTALRG